MEELILKEREFKEKIIELINSYNLPAILIKPVIKEVLEQLTIIEQSQYQAAKKSKNDEVDLCSNKKKAGEGAKK